jgi:hypothetical protein
MTLSLEQTALTVAYLQGSGLEQKPLGKNFVISSISPYIQKCKTMQIVEDNKLSMYEKVNSL